MKDRGFDKSIFESERWISFLESTAKGLGLDFLFIFHGTDDGCMKIPVLCPLCSKYCAGLTQAELDEISAKYNGQQLEMITGKGKSVVVTPLGKASHVIAINCSCCGENHDLTPLKQRTDTAKKLFSSFYLALNEGFEGGIKTFGLSAIRKINYNILSIFKGDSEALTRSFDIILSSLVIMLEAQGSWIRIYDETGPTLLVKGDDTAVNRYLEGKGNSAIGVEICNGTTKAYIGVLGAQDTAQAEYFLHLMAQECALVIEIDHVFKLLQRKTSQVLGAIGSGILLVDVYRTIIYVNKAGEKILEAGQADLLGRRIDVAAGPWLPFIKAGPENRVNGCMDSMTGLSEQKLVDWQICPLKEDDDIKGWVIVLEDRSDYYRWQEAVRQAERFETTAMMVGALAHEMRNPLSAARGLLQLMSVKREPEQVRGYTDLILREIDRVTRLLSEFLLLGKPAQMSSEPVDVESLMNELLPLLTSEASGKGVEVELAAKAVSPVLADPGQLTQAVMNLARNAVEAAGDGGNVLITLNEADNEIILTIRDDGPGIPPEAFERIFQPFYSAKKHGTGLGLPVVRAIIHNHQGQITAANAAEGGAQFTIRIPAITANQEGELRAQVVVAIGDRMVRYPTERALKAARVSTVSVNCIEDAASLADRCYPCIIICLASENKAEDIEAIRKKWPDTAIMIMGKDSDKTYGDNVRFVSETQDLSSMLHEVQRLLNNRQSGKMPE